MTLIKCETGEYEVLDNSDKSVTVLQLRGGNLQALHNDEGWHIRHENNLYYPPDDTTKIILNDLCKRKV